VSGEITKREAYNMRNVEWGSAEFKKKVEAAEAIKSEREYDEAVMDAMDTIGWI